MKSAIKAFLVLLIISTAALLAFLVLTGYHDLIDKIGKVTNSSQQAGEIKELISPVVINRLSGFIAVNLLLFIVILSRFKSVFELVEKFVSSACSSVMYRFKNYGEPSLFVLLAVPLAAAVWFAIKMPVSNDEAYTYVRYIARSIFASAFYYRDPNNHILHSIIANVFTGLPFPTLASIRLPVIIISLLNFFILFFLVREYFNRNLALLVTCVYSTFFMTIYYSFVSRGYTLQVLAFLLLTYGTFKITDQPRKKVYWIYYGIGTIIGFYSLPSFLYVFILANVFLLIRFKTIIKEHVFFNLLFGFGVLYLYTPVFIFNGIRAVSGNKFVLPLKRIETLQNLPGFMYDAFTEITGLPFWLVLALFIAGMAVLVVRYNQLQRLYFPFIILATPILLIIHSIIPYGRTVNYWGVSIAVIVSVLFMELIRKTTFNAKLVTILVILQVAMVLNFNKIVQVSDRKWSAAAETISVISDGKHFYTCSNLFDNFLTFDLKTRGIDSYNLHYVIAVPVNLDTVAVKAHYDYMIVDTDLDRTTALKPYSKNEFYTVYKPYKITGFYINKTDGTAN